MSTPPDILIQNYVVLQNLVGQEYNSIQGKNIYDTALRTQDSLGNYIVTSFINYTLTNIANPNFIHDIVHANPNVLLFFAQNPNLMTFFSTPDNLTLYENYLISSFTNIIFGFEEGLQNPKTDLYCYIINYYPALQTYLNGSVSQNCTSSGIIQTHNSVLGSTPEILQLLSTYPLFNYLINQNYMYEIYYKNLFQNANLVALLLQYPTLLYAIILGTDGNVNPNILNLLGFYTNLTYNFNFYSPDVTYFLSLPSIRNININLYNYLLTTTLQPYLDNSIVYPIIDTTDNTEAVRNAILLNYPSLNILIHQNYNYNLYQNMIMDKNVITLISYALSQFELNKVLILYENYPNIITDIIDFNPNLIAFFYDNPNLTNYLATNAKTLYDFLVYKGSETFNLKNPMTDLYNNFATPFLSAQNLTYLLNNNPNPPPTDGSQVYIGNGTSSVLTIYNNNIYFFYLINQNYVYNMYYNNLFYNKLLLDILLNQYYDPNTNTYTTDYYTSTVYDTFNTYIYNNPNLINFFTKNPKLLTDYLSGSEANLTAFLAIPNINIPYYDLNDILFQYDLQYGTSYCSYLTNSFNAFFSSTSTPTSSSSSSTYSNLPNLLALTQQNYDTYSGTYISPYIPSNYNNGKNVYQNLFQNNDLFINFITFFKDQANTYDPIEWVTQNPNFLTFLSNHYNLLFYFKENPIDYIRFSLYEDGTALLPSTDLVPLIIAFSAETYPETPLRVSQNLNTSLPISGPYSGIGNNPATLALLSTYPLLNSIVTQNYNYNLFYIHLYNNGSTNIVDLLAFTPSLANLVIQNPLLLHLLFYHQRLIPKLTSNPSILTDISLSDTPYIDIYQIILQNNSFPYLNNLKAIIHNYANVASILYQTYISTPYHASYQNLYYEHMQDTDLVDFFYYTIQQHDYHTKVAPSNTYYQYPQIMDLLALNPNLINFFFQYKTLRIYLEFGVNTGIPSPTPTVSTDYQLALYQILSLTSLRDPYTNIYTAIHAYATTTGNTDILTTLEVDKNPYYGSYITQIGTSEEMEAIQSITNPNLRTLFQADYNDSLYYNAVFLSKPLQQLILTNTSNPLFTHFLTQNPNSLLFLSKHPTLTELLRTNLNALTTFLEGEAPRLIHTDLTQFYQNVPSLRIHLDEASHTLLQEFASLQPLFNPKPYDTPSTYLQITQYNLYPLTQPIVTFFYYCLNLHREDRTFPNLYTILLSNPNLIRFLYENSSILGFFSTPSSTNQSLLKLALEYSYTTLPGPTTFTLLDPTTNLTTFFQNFQSTYPTATYTVNTSVVPFHAHVTAITPAYFPVLDYPSTKLQSLITSYSGLQTLAEQSYNNNVYYIALQNEYLLDLINASLAKYNSLAWPTQIIDHVIYRNPNFLTFLTANPDLLLYYIQHIDSLLPLLQTIQASTTPCTLNLYDIIQSDLTLAPYLNPTPPPVADQSGIGVKRTTSPLVNEINNLSGIVYQNYNKNIYYRVLYSLPKLNSIVNSTPSLQTLATLNPNVITFLANYPQLVDLFYADPSELAIFTSISSLEYPTNDIIAEINTYAPSFNTYITNQSILYTLLTNPANTRLLSLISQSYFNNIYYESLYSSFELIWLLLQQPSILPIFYQNPNLLLFLTNPPPTYSLFDYLLYDTSLINYIPAITSIPNLGNMYANLNNIPFTYYFMRDAIFQGGAYPNVFINLFLQDYNIQSDNTNVYQNSMYDPTTCNYMHYTFDKFFYLYGITAFATTYDYTFPDIFALLTTNPNILNFLFKNPNLLAYQRSQPINDYRALTNFWGVLNAQAMRLTQNVYGIIDNPSFYLHTNYYNPSQYIYYELGNTTSILLSKYAIFTNILQQNYNSSFYQTLIYQSDAFQNFITSYPLSIIFNAFNFNANLISFLSYNANLTTYMISNSSDIYYFLNNLDTQNPNIDLNSVILYNDLNRPTNETNYPILYTYLQNYFQDTLNDPYDILLKNLYLQYYNQNVYTTTIQDRDFQNFLYFYRRVYEKFNGTFPTFPNILNVISTNPNLLQFLILNKPLMAYLSSDTLLDTSFGNSYVYKLFTYTYTSGLNTFTISNPLTNYDAFVTSFSTTYADTTLSNLLQTTTYTYNIYDVGTTTELTDLINQNTNLEILLNQLYNLEPATTSSTTTQTNINININIYYNVLYQNKYLVQLLASSSSLLDAIYLNPNILLYLYTNPNLIIALLSDPALLATFLATPDLTSPNTNLFDLISTNNTVPFTTYCITFQEMFVQNFAILESLKNQFYLHEFYLHKLIPPSTVTLQNQRYNYLGETTPLIQLFQSFYETIYVPNIFSILETNPNLIAYFYYQPQLIQYLIYNPNYLQSYFYTTSIQNPVTNLQTFTQDYFTASANTTAISSISCDESFYQILLKSKDQQIYPNDLLTLLNTNPSLKEIAYQAYTINSTNTLDASIYLYHLNTPNIITLLSNPNASTLLTTIYQNPSLVVFLTNSPESINYLNNFENEIQTLVALPGVSLPITNLYTLFLSSTTFAPYTNSLDQILFDSYRLFSQLFAQVYNKNLYYQAYRSSTPVLQELIYTSILSITPNLVDLFEENANLMLFLSQNPKLMEYFNTPANFYDFVRFLNISTLSNPSVDIYATIIQKLAYLKPYLSQIPIALQSGVGTTPNLITLLNQFSDINSFVNQNYNQNVYYTALYNNPTLVTLLTNNALLRTCISYNNNIITFLDTNPALLVHFVMTPGDLQIFLTNNGILDPVTNLYDFIVTYLPALAPLLVESLTGIYSTIGTKFALTTLLEANPKLNAIINQNYNANIYYLDLYNNDDLVTLLSTPSTSTTISSAQRLLTKVYLNPNILNFLNNNPALSTFFLTSPTYFSQFIDLTIQTPYQNIDTLVKTTIPYLMQYLTQISIGLESTVGTTTALTNLISTNALMDMYANQQNYIENLYYTNLYKVPDLVAILTTSGSPSTPTSSTLSTPSLYSLLLQNPNILDVLASNPSLCKAFVDSEEKLLEFLSLPAINQMTTNIYELLRRSTLYGNIDSIETNLQYNLFENRVPQFYNDYLFERAFQQNIIYEFLYDSLGISLPNGPEVFRLNQNLFTFFVNNPALTQQLYLEHLLGYDYNIINILGLTGITDPVQSTTALLTAYIQSPLNVTLSISLLNTRLPKTTLASIGSTIGKTSDLTYLLETNPKLLSLILQNYNENIYYKSLYFNPYLVALLLLDASKGGALLDLIYINNTLLNFLAYNPVLVTHLNEFYSSTSIITENQNLKITTTNIYDELMNSSLNKYLNITYIMLYQKYPILEQIITQNYNGTMLNSTNTVRNLNGYDPNIYLTAIQNPYVAYLIYYGAILSSNTTATNILDLISSNTNLILFLYNNLDLTKDMIYNETDYRIFLQLPSLGSAQTDLTAVITSSAPALRVYLNTALPNGGLTSGVGTTPVLTTLLTNNTILNTIVSTNYIENIYYANLYQTPTLVTLINQSTSLLQYIYTNPNIINFLATNPKLISYFLSKSAYVTGFLQIPNVNIMSTNLSYETVLYETLLNTYTPLRTLVNQIYNLLPGVPSIYVKTLQNTNILEFLYYAIQNVPAKDIVTQVIYGNPNFINFLYDNPNLVSYFTQNTSIFQNYMTLGGLNSPVVDMYEVVKYFGTNTQNPDIIAQLNQTPSIPGPDSGIGTTTTLTTLLENNPSLKSLVYQNYNFNIYYIYLLKSPTLVNLLTNNPNLLNAIYRNPNIITFLGNNPNLIFYFFNNPFAIEYFLSIPNVTDPTYDLYSLVLNYTTSSTSVSFASFLNRSFYVLMDTYSTPPQDLKTIVFNFTEEPQSPSTLNYQMNNTYFHTFSTNSSLVDFIYIQLSNPLLPNIIDKMVKNPNIINYLGKSDINYLNSFINTYYKNIISNPLIEDPANDIDEINIPLFNPNPSYFQNAYYLKTLYSIADEKQYYNNLIVNNTTIRRILQQNYGKGYEYNLVQTPLLLYLLNNNSFPYLNFMINVIPNNPNVIHFLANNPYLLKDFFTTPAHFTAFQTILGIQVSYNDIETLVNARPVIAPYLTINVMASSPTPLSTSLQTLMNQRYQHGIYRNALYHNPELYDLCTSSALSTLFSQKMETNPHILIFLAKNPRLTTYFKYNTDALLSFTNNVIYNDPLVDLYTTLLAIPEYATYLNKSLPLDPSTGTSYTTVALTALLAANPTLASLTSQRYIGNYEANLYYDQLYKNPNLVTLLATYPSLVAAISTNPSILLYFSKNCGNPVSSGTLSLVERLQANPTDVTTFLAIPNLTTDPTLDLNVILDSTTFSTNLTKNNLPDLYGNPLYTNLLSLVDQTYNNEAYYNAFYENNGIYDFINYVYGLYQTALPTPPFRNIFLLLNNNANILTYLAENRIASYLTQPVNYSDTYFFMNISQIDRFQTNVYLYVRNTDLLNPSPTIPPVYTTPSLTLLLNTNPDLKAIVEASYNKNYYYDRLYNNPNVVTLLLMNTGVYANLMPTVIANPTIINFLCTFPNLTIDIMTNENDFQTFITIVGINIASNNLVELVAATYLRTYLNEDYLFLYDTAPTITNLINQPYNEGIYYKYLNKDENIAKLIRKYDVIAYSPSLLTDVIALNPNMINFLGKNPNLVSALYTNDALYQTSFITLFGTFSTPNANNSPTTNLYTLIGSIPALAPFLSAPDPVPGYTTPALLSLLATYPTLASIVYQNYNDYIYYNNLYYVSDLVTFLMGKVTLLNQIYQNPNILLFLAYQLYLLSNKLSTTPTMVTELVNYVAGKNPTYPTTATTSDNYLLSMQNLFYDNPAPDRQLWKYTNTAYLGYGTLTPQFTNQPAPLSYSFTILDTIVRIPYNEAFFYRSLYQNQAIASPSLKIDYNIHLIGYISRNFSSSNFITSIAYNPHLLNFLSDNPSFVYALETNTDILELFIYNTAIGLSKNDIYKFYKNMIPLPSQTIPYRINSMVSVVNGSQALRTLLLQTYNDTIYYSSLSYSSTILIPFLLYLIQTSSILVSQMCSNPNIILFLSNNLPMVQYLLENPASIAIFTANPNITDVSYNLVQITYSTVLESYLDPNTYQLYNDTQNTSIYELLSQQYNNNIISASNRGALSPQVPQTDSYMVNLYYDALMKGTTTGDGNGYVSRFIEYAKEQYLFYKNNFVYAMSDYPEIMNLLETNANILSFLYRNPDLCNYLQTTVSVTPTTKTPLYHFLKIPILSVPNKDIGLYIQTSATIDPVTYGVMSSKLDITIYRPRELDFLNNQSIINGNPTLYEFVNQLYNSGIYICDLFDFSNNIITIFIANPTSLFYQAVYLNPSILNFFVEYNQLTLYLANNPLQIPIFINIPNITKMIPNLYDTISSYQNVSPFEPYLDTYLGDNSNLITYELNEVLQTYPEIYVVFYANNTYQNKIYQALTGAPNLVNLLYLYPYMDEICIEYPPLLYYLSYNAFGDTSFVKYLKARPWQMVYRMEQLVSDHLTYVTQMNALICQNYNYEIYRKAFYYNTIYESITDFILDTSIYTPILSNPNILHFMYNNPRLLDYYYNTTILGWMEKNALFQSLYNQCTSMSTDITVVFAGNPILAPYLNTSLSVGGAIPPTPELTALLSSNPVLQGIIAQNYNYNLYYNELNNNTTLVKLLSAHPSLITLVETNPNIIHYLYNHPSLVIYLYQAKVCNKDYVDLITTNPTVTDPYTDLYQKYLQTTFQGYYKPSTLLQPYRLNQFLGSYPLIQELLNQQYNGNIYYNSFVAQPSMILLYTLYPTILNYIALNPNIINFLANNPNFIDFFKYYHGANISNLIFLYQLTNNIDATNTTGIIDPNTIQSASNPVIDLYKFYYSKLPQYLSKNQNILGATNGYGSTANLNQLLQRNGTLKGIVQQNYNYNIYWFMLLFSPTLVMTLLTYSDILFYFVYKNPNMINFLFYNNALLMAFLSNPTLVTFFYTLSFCNNPMNNLFDSIYEYDVSNSNNPIKLSTYLDKTMYVDLIGNVGPDGLLTG